jgi:hypothetical protein
MAKSTRTKGRIAIPKNIEEHLDLASSVYNKHLADGEASLLKNLADYDWTVLGPKIAECLAKHKEAEECKRKMEDAYKERDLMFPEIEEAVRAGKAMLKGVFSKNPKKLGEWGFNVDDTPKTKKPKEEKKTE